MSKFLIGIFQTHPEGREVSEQAHHPLKNPVKHILHSEELECHAQYNENYHEECGLLDEYQLSHLSLHDVCLPRSFPQLFTIAYLHRD